MFEIKLNSQTSISILVVLISAALAFMVTTWFLHPLFESWVFWMVIPISSLIAHPSTVAGSLQTALDLDLD